MKLSWEFAIVPTSYAVDSTAAVEAAPGLANSYYIADRALCQRPDAAVWLLKCLAFDEWLHNLSTHVWLWISQPFCVCTYDLEFPMYKAASVLRLGSTAPATALCCDCLRVQSCAFVWHHDEPA